MATVNAKRVIGGLLLATVLGGCRGENRPAPVTLGNPAPSAIFGAVKPGIWLGVPVRVEDCLSCEIPSGMIRDLQRGDEGLPVVAFLSGPLDPIVSDFFEGMRIDADLRPLDPELYHATFGGIPPSSLLLFREGQLVAIREPTGKLTIGPGVLDLREVVRSVSPG